MTDKRSDYTVPQVAKELGCSPGTVRNRIREGTIIARRLPGPKGRNFRIPWAEVERLKNQLYSPDTETAL